MGLFYLYLYLYLYCQYMILLVISHNESPEHGQESFQNASFLFCTKMTDKMQLCRIIYCSLTALHVSSDIFAHHQEHLNLTL